MAKDMYHPSSNYERNFLLVKKFGGKPIVVLIPLLLFLHILCMGYLSIMKKEALEITLFRLVTSKLLPDLNFDSIKDFMMIFSGVTALFFIFIFLSFFFTCRDPSDEAVPNVSLAISYYWSMLQLFVFSICFALSAVFLLLFAFKPPEFFEELVKTFNVTLEQIKAFRVSILLGILLACAIFALLIWFYQSQATFIKSLQVTLVNSVARNKGAHVYGVFSMSVAIALLFMAGAMTFLYYCYKDAFNGFGISMEPVYVYVSLALAYIRGLVPFLVSVCALTFSEMVDEANTLGTVYYNEVDMLGDAQDPNMGRKVTKSRDVKIIKG